MHVVIDSKGFTFDGNRFTYDLYYVEGEYYDAPTPGGVFKKILSKWATVLGSISDSNGPMYLPFAPDDQWVDCIMATPKGNRLVMSVARVAETGYSVDFSDLESFIRSPHPVDHTDECFGEFEKDEFVFALLHAEVIDE